MNKKKITIDYEEYSSFSELSEADKDLCEEAQKALINSHSPYSRFRVGAAVKLKSGHIVYGSNQENVAYPSGLCAERVALFTIGANFPGDIIVAMAITAHTDEFSISHPITSCGACLQVMSEYEKKQGSPVEVIFYCDGGEALKVSEVSSLMPFGFTEKRLENK